MPLIEKTEAQKIAERIDGINEELFSYVRARMAEAHGLANTPGKQQAIMDVFGTNAAAALNVYAVMKDALDQVGRGQGLGGVDTTVFQPEVDGSVSFVQSQN